MKMKPRYSMPDDRDRTDHKRLRGMRDEAISYDDVPRLDDPAWRGAPGASSAFHVVPTDAGWRVRRSGSARDIAKFDTKTQAVRLARANAKKERSALVVHDRDGTIREYVLFAAE